MKVIRDFVLTFAGLFGIGLLAAQPVYAGSLADASVGHNWTKEAVQQVSMQALRGFWQKNAALMGPDGLGDYDEAVGTAPQPARVASISRPAAAPSVKRVDLQALRAFWQKNAALMGPDGLGDYDEAFGTAPQPARVVEIAPSIEEKPVYTLLEHVSLQTLREMWLNDSIIGQLDGLTDYGSETTESREIAMKEGQILLGS